MPKLLALEQLRQISNTAGEKKTGSASKNSSTQHSCESTAGSSKRQHEDGDRAATDGDE